LLCTPISSDPKDTQIKFSRTLAAFEKFLGNGGQGDPCQAGGSAASAQNTPAPSQASAQSSGNSCGAANEKASAAARFNQARQCQCAPASESAEKLCVESDSMKALRTIMDAAGPVLLGLNAAQKTCGGMADVTKFVGAGLTLANALCIRQKMKCESTCQAAMTSFKTDYDKFMGEVKSAYENEAGVANEKCKQHIADAETASTANPPPQNKELLLKYAKECQIQNAKLDPAINNAVSASKQIYAGETSPASVGTVPSMDALCKDKMRNIVGIASNIGAIALAMTSAKKCEKDLATAAAQGNTAAANVSTAEYCSADATKDTQFCKCQNNSTAEGCGSSLVSSTANGDPAADQRGVDLKNFGGASGFAGGGGSGVNGSYKGSYGADGTPLDQTAQAALSAGTATGTGAAIPGFGSSGAVAAGADGNVEAKKGAGKADDKKWSFGSFASSVGGALGFGNNSKFEGNGSLKAASKEAIERKIASDRYAAEISPSTGADNFAKIKRSYVQKADTFMAAP
jgi:hypothetical protein